MNASIRKTLARHLGNGGQSLTETVVMLPVLLMIFLGLFYMRELTSLRIRALEASRYVTWETVWHGRFNGVRGDDQLRRDLIAMGLGEGLVEVRGALQRRSLEDYADATDGSEPNISFIPVIGNAFEGEDEMSSIEDFLGSIQQGVDFVMPLFDFAADLAFRGDQLMAAHTNWEDESNYGVYTTRVVYRMPAVGFFAPLGRTTVDQRGSLLTHAYNVRRVDNKLLQLPPDFSGSQAEWDEVFGAHDEFCDTDGRIFDLWLFPTGNFGSVVDSSVVNTIGGAVQGVGRAAKCTLIAVNSAVNALEGSLPDMLASGLGWQMPSGTLKEYPEKRMLKPTPAPGAATPTTP